MFGKNKNKKLYFYALFKKDSPENFLTITCTKDDAIEFAEKQLYLEHKNHYEMWCNLKEINPCAAMWEVYYTSCISEEEKREYLISKISYTMEALASVLRMFGNCDPIGCSFDSPIEEVYFKSREISNKFKDEILNAWDSIGDEVNKIDSNDPDANITSLIENITKVKKSLNDNIKTIKDTTEEFIELDIEEKESDGDK